MKLTSLLQRSIAMHRVFAISDIHIDHAENRSLVYSWSHDQFKDDALILAGDVTDSMSLLKETLQHLNKVFSKVFYVPGNHELWLRNTETEIDSIDKFHNIMSLCKDIGIGTKPELFPLSDTENVHIVPLFSWYATPEEDMDDSLYIKQSEPDDQSHAMWMDNHLCKWPNFRDSSRSKYFANLNLKICPRENNVPVISFSHFLPRIDIIQPSEDERKEMDAERSKLGHECLESAEKKGNLNPKNFNFSLYAGCKVLETQLREIGASVHVFGHQHRNKDRMINGVRYVSHCMGYKRERDAGLVTGMNQQCSPKQIWPPLS